MWAGRVISGAGHAALIALTVWGLPWFAPRDREAIRVTEVSFVSEAEFQAAMTAAESTPDAPPEPAAPPTAVEATPPPPMPEVVRGPSAATPEALPDTSAEAEPEMPATEPTLAPTFDPESPLAMESPDFSSITPQVVTVAPPTAAAPPQPRPVTRIAPDPAPAPPETARPAPDTTVAAAPEPEAEREVEVEAAAPEAPPEAAPEPVTEPSPPAELALTTSSRPVPRRGNVAPVTAPAPAPTQTATPATPSAPAPPPEQPARQQEILDAVAAAAADATAPTAPSVTQPTPPAASSLPVGPPISASERDGLKFAIQRCWNVPAGLRDAQDLKITVAAELDSDGAVISSSVRLVEPASIPDGRYDAAWRAARTALLRCSPYSDLPREKFAQWRNIEVVFNPEGMVSW